MTSPTIQTGEIPTVEELVREMYDESGQPLPEEQAEFEDERGDDADYVLARMIVGLPEKVAKVLDALGPDLAVRLTGASDPDLVADWANQASMPPASMAQRACMAFTVTRELEKLWPADMIQSWFGGTNSGLNGESPADVIAEQDFSAAAGLMASATLAEFTK